MSGYEVLHMRMIDVNGADFPTRFLIRSAAHKSMGACVRLEESADGDFDFELELPRGWVIVKYENDYVIRCEPSDTDYLEYIAESIKEIECHNIDTLRAGLFERLVVLGQRKAKAEAKRIVKALDGK